MTMATTRSATAAGAHGVADDGGDMGAELARVDEEVRAFVKERPILALLGAVAAGYVLGRMLRGRA
jgi:hypothetical protein